jgi:hypothetical protein
MEKFQVKSITRSTKVERKYEVTGKVKFVETYMAKTKNGEVPGLVITLDELPYPVRVLKGSIKGANASAGSILGCTVTMTGNTRTYQDNEYFNPLDCTVVQQSGLSKLAIAGVAYAGSLD